MYTSIRIEVKSGQQNYLKNDQQNLIKKIFSLLTLHMQLLATHCPECKSIIDSSGRTWSERKLSKQERSGCWK
jgi:hypothetical protein